ncbi:glycosyltransferase involved in cell wall biosynthesis [Rhizobium sp. PP-F2F-G20b]|nr:glycosyltransferase involved in cell wall biosynthesis [Rhizobium sp. PP-F2F-G20b]
MLDHNFYRKYYLNGSDLTDQDIQIHWENEGMKNQYFPNPDLYLEDIVSSNELPSDFDIYTYLEFNKDVAASISWPFEAALHYLNYGVKEKRRYSFSITSETSEYSSINSERASIDRVDIEELAKPAYRLLEHHDRSNWLMSAREIVAGQSAAALRRKHPRGLAAATLDFNLASYMHRYADVSEASEGDPLLALFHYLEFGVEEKRNGEPSRIDARFMSAYYSVEVAKGDAVSHAMTLVRKSRPAADEVYFVNEYEWATFNGIKNTSFLKLFDHEYYRCLVNENGFLAKSRWSCIRHFWVSGRFEPLDISPDAKFDPSYYAREYYPTIPQSQSAAKSVPQLFNDWVETGIERGESPNMSAWLAARMDVPYPEGFSKLLKDYAFLAGESFATDNETAAHMLTAGNQALLKLEIENASVATFITKLADRYALAGNLSLSDGMYHSAAASVPGNFKALQHQSDQLERSGFLGAAAALREAALEKGSEDVWTYLTLSSVYDSLHKLDESAQVLVQASTKFPGDHHIRALRRKKTRQAFDALWISAPNRALNDGYGHTQDLIKSALLRYTERTEFPNSRPRTIARIAIVANYDIAQCKLYRVDQKMEQLEKLSYFVRCFDYIKDLETFFEEASNFDAVIFFRVPSFPPVIDAITLANDLGLYTFYDIDDLIFVKEEFPPALSTYAGSISHQLHAEIACGVPLFAHAMRLCKYGIASTSSLVPYMETLVKNGKVFIHPNGMGSEHELAVLKRTRRAEDIDTCRIFYGSGTRAHKEDFYEILEPALVQLGRKYGKRIEIYLLGYFEWTEDLLSIKECIKLMNPIWDLGLYWETLSKMDINLAVLAPSTASDTKSEIKWLEAAMFGIPSVVSRTQTYSDVISNGVTGLLCDTSEEFYNNIARLVDDLALRKEIGQNGQLQVMKSYSLEKLSQNWPAMFSSVIEKQRTRLLVVNVFYAPQSIGGATRVVQDNISDILLRYGDEFEIDVICTLEGGTEPLSVEVYSVKSVRVFAITAPSEPDIDLAPSHPAMGEVFSKCLDVIKPDLIHFHCIQRLTAAVTEVALKRRIPYLITVHDGWWISDHQFLLDADDRIRTYEYSSSDAILKGGKVASSTRAVALRKALFNADHVLTISAVFEELYRGAGVPNIITVPNGLPQISRVEKIRSFNGKVRLAHIGGMERHKGFHIVKYALLAGDYDKLELLVIDATLPTGAERWEKWGATDVHFRGRTRQENVGELYAKIDVLLAPSVWPEGFGLVSREALACGCWVVASNRGAIGDDVIEDENGHIVDVTTTGPISRVFELMNDNVGKYLEPPSMKPVLRRSVEQADQLASLYRGMLK